MDFEFEDDFFHIRMEIGQIITDMDKLFNRYDKKMRNLIVALCNLQEKMEKKHHLNPNGNKIL